MNKNYSLVIQGPMLSIGRTGKTHLKYSKGKKSEVVAFDCGATVQRILNTFSAQFKEVVLVTWEGEDITSIDVDAYPNFKLIQLEPLEQRYLSDFHPTGEINLLKQVVTTQAGIEALQYQDPNQYIVKIRTDQYLDLERLLEEHQQMIEQERQQKIGIPFLSNYGIGDFYFVARQQVLSNFCKAVIALLPQDPRMDPVRFSVHLIMPVLYERSLRGKDAVLGDMIYLKSMNQQLKQGTSLYPNAAILEDYIKFIGAYFVCFSKTVFESVIWRGDHYEMSVDSTATFGLSWDEHWIKGPPIDAFNIFLYFSPRRYFEKQGTWNSTALLGIINFVLMSILPFYQNWVIQRTKRQ